MINVVVDTNIFISAVLSPNGNPAKVIEYITDQEEIRLFYATKIFNEYERVLSYKRLNIDDKSKGRTLNLIRKIGILVNPVASIVQFSDETDRIFYDTALASGSTLITGNIKHFPDDSFIMLPTTFLEKYK